MSRRSAQGVSRFRQRAWSRNQSPEKWVTHDVADHEEAAEGSRDVEDVLGVVPQESVEMSGSCVAGGNIAPDGGDAGSPVPEQLEFST